MRVQKNKAGTWYARLYLGTNAVTGKKMRPYKTFPQAKTKEEALNAAQEWANGLAAASNLHTSQKLSDVLTRYVDMLEAGGASPNTVKTYRSNIRCYVEPYIGDVAVEDVQPYMLDDLYTSLLLSGTREGNGISADKVINLHWFLSGAYKWFIRQGVATVNPVSAATKPARPMHEAVAYNEMEFSRLEAALRKELENDSVETDAIFRRNVAFAAYLSLYTGERCGEVCANTVADAQLLRHIMHISHTAVESDGMVWRKPKPKGKKSRNVALDDGTVQAIKRHYAWQAGYLPSRLCNSSERTICTDAEGGILRPHKVSEAFRDIRDAANLPKNTSFHTLRHTHATWLLLSGVDLKTISERLGHANEALTLQIYSHVMPGRDEAAAATFARTATAFGGGAYGIR